MANELGTYQPSHDFYRQFRDAILLGILNDDDVARLNRAIDKCNPKRRKHYEALSVGWARWRRGKHLEGYSQKRHWLSEGLDVKVSPQFVWRDHEATYLVWPYLKEPEVSRDGIQAAIRLIEMTHPGDGYEAALLDVRRGKIHLAAKRRRKGFDAWLTSEAAAFISLLGSIRNVA